MSNRKFFIIIIILLPLFILAYTLFSNNKTPNVEVNSVDINKTISVWDPETASNIEYPSYEEYEKESEFERNKEIEEYNTKINGTVAEYLQNTYIPSYHSDEGLVKLQDGRVEVLSEPDDEFPDGILDWYASLVRNIDYYTVGDFNNDGLEDVAHVIGYSGGGSGYFSELTVFINEDGELKYSAQKTLGDRIVVKGIKYESGIFTIDMIVQGEGDDFKGFCCPNVPKQINLVLDSDRLLLQEKN